MSGSKPEIWKPAKTGRYVVSVDRQAKSSFASEEAAQAEAQRISDGFPNVVVAVSDTEKDTVRRLGALTSTTEQDLTDPEQASPGDANDRQA